MSQGKKTGWLMGCGIFAVLLVILIIVCCFSAYRTYNSLVPYSESVDKAWADVENQYQRRFDLIPNLVETVKGYAQHEKETYENVTRARAGLTDAYNKAKQLDTDDISNEASFDKYNSAQQDLNKALSIYVNAVHEAYPDLKANENFRDLQVELEGTENRIAVERRNYTEAVQAYNIQVRRFPANIWAGIFGFQPKPQFKAVEEAQTAPKVQF